MGRREKEGSRLRRFVLLYPFRENSSVQNVKSNFISAEGHWLLRVMTYIKNSKKCFAPAPGMKDFY